MSTPYPEYNEDEPLEVYIKRVQDYELKLKQKPYNLFLDFVNEWLKLGEDTRYKQLTDFKNVPEKYLLSDKKNNRKILRKYSKRIKSELKIKIKIDEDTDSEEIKDRYIIFFATRALASINYSLTVKTTKKGDSYTIVSK